MNQELFIHYWQLPEELFVSLKDNFHKKFCLIIQNKVNCKFKNCFHKILNCPKWHAQRLFTKYIRFTIKELETLRKIAQISKEETEKNLETLGNYEDGTIIRNLKLPFHLKDIFYVASHLIFDGSFRFDKGGYFYAYETSLIEYHKRRLGTFGEVPVNLIKKENHLYFSYTLGYIASKILDVKTFRSKKCILSNKFKSLAKKYKIITDEIIKAVIIDEGSIGDKIQIELANKELVENLYDIIQNHYKLTKLFSRRRYNISFKGDSYKHNLSAWGFGFSAESFVDLHKSISPLPINYKQENLEFLYKLQTRGWKQRKHHGETQRLIVLSLLNKPKTLSELAKELCMRQTTISTSIRKLPMITKIDEIILRRGGYARANIFGVKDVTKAQEFLNR